MLTFCCVLASCETPISETIERTNESQNTHICFMSTGFLISIEIIGNISDVLFFSFLLFHYIGYVIKDF